MNFSELRKKRASAEIPVELEDGEIINLYSPTVQGVRAVLKASDERKTQEDSNQAGATLVALMLQACSGEEQLSLEEAEQAIYDCGGPTGPVAVKLMELIYGKDAGKALKVDPISSDVTSESPTSES